MDAAAARPTTAKVERRSIKFAVTAAGDIGPAEQVSVRPEVNGKISALNVDIGDRAKKGDVLFTLDDRDLQTELSTQMTQIDGAKLQLARTKRNFERSEELFEAQLISQELFEDTKTEYELAKNSLERAEKNLHLVEDRLLKTKIIAPFDCTILTRPVSIGQAVSGSGGFNSGTEVLTIADLQHMIVNAHVNQADVTRLTVGQQVNILIDSVPGLQLDGVVERIAPQSTIKNSIKGYATRIVVRTLDPRVLPGMTANVSIPVASAEDAVAVPLAAVFSEQGDRYVYVKTGETFEKRPVQIGIADYEYAEVESGLNGGEIVSLEERKDAKGGGKSERSERSGARPAQAGMRAAGTNQAGLKASAPLAASASTNRPAAGRQ